MLVSVSKTPLYDHLVQRQRELFSELADLPLVGSYARMGRKDCTKEQLDVAIADLEKRIKQQLSVLEVSFVEIESFLESRKDLIPGLVY